MAASVRIEDEAFADERYAKLARLLGLADADHARGKMARLWRQCTIENTYVLPIDDVIGVLGEHAIAALTDARLGEVVSDGVRIRGTLGRIEWRDTLRNNGKYGKLGGRPKKPSRVIDGKPGRVTKKAKTETPPAPAPAQEEEEKRGLSPVREFAEAAIGELNRLTGRGYDPAGKAVVMDCEKLVADKFTPDQAVAVVRAKHTEWRGNEKMREQIKPSVLLRPSNFRRYVVDLAGEIHGNGRRPDVVRHELL